MFFSFYGYGFMQRKRLQIPDNPGRSARTIHAGGKSKPQWIRDRKGEFSRRLPSVTCEFVQMTLKKAHLAVDRYQQ